MDICGNSMQLMSGCGSGSSPVHDHSQSKWPKCTKTYNSRWESDPLLKTWISRHPEDIGKVVCSFCQSVIRAHKNDLLEHTRTLKHQRNFMAHATPEEYNLFVMELNELRKDAQLVTKKKVAVGKSCQSSAVGAAPVSLNGASGNWRTPSNHVTVEAHALSVGGVVPTPSAGTCGGSVSMDLWPNDTIDNDSFMSADSPSDLVSVILEEQEQGEGDDDARSSAQLSGNGNSNESLPPTLTPNPLSSSSSPQHHLPLSIQSFSSSSTAALGLSTNCVHTTHGGTHRAFTAADVMSAMEEEYFSTSDLWSLAKCALGLLESRSLSGAQGEQSACVDVSSSNHVSTSQSPQPPHVHTSPQSPPIFTNPTFVAATTFASFPAATPTNASYKLSHKRSGTRADGRGKGKRRKLPEEEEETFTLDGVALDVSTEQGRDGDDVEQERVFPLITLKIEG